MEEMKLYISELGDVAQLIEYLPSLHEALGSVLTQFCIELDIKLGIVAHICNRSAWELKAGGS